MGVDYSKFPPCPDEFAPEANCPNLGTFCHCVADVEGRGQGNACPAHPRTFYESCRTRDGWIFFQAVSGLTGGLIVIAILVYLLVLGRKHWKRRNHQDGEPNAVGNEDVMWELPDRVDLWLCLSLNKQGLDGFGTLIGFCALCFWPCLIVWSIDLTLSKTSGETEFRDPSAWAIAFSVVWPLVTCLFIYRWRRKKVKQHNAQVRRSRLSRAKHRTAETRARETDSPHQPMETPAQPVSMQQVEGIV